MCMAWFKGLKQAQVLLSTCHLNMLWLKQQIKLLRRNQNRRATGWANFWAFSVMHLSICGWSSTVNFWYAKLLGYGGQMMLSCHNMPNLWTWMPWTNLWCIYLFWIRSSFHLLARFGWLQISLCLALVILQWITSILANFQHIWMHGLWTNSFFVSVQILINLSSSFYFKASTICNKIGCCFPAVGWTSCPTMLCCLSSCEQTCEQRGRACGRWAEIGQVLAREGPHAAGMRTNAGGSEPYTKMLMAEHACDSGRDMERRTRELCQLSQRVTGQDQWRVWCDMALVWTKPD